MSLKLLRPLVVFDAETTSADASTAKIVSLCFIKINPDKTRERLDLLVNPGIPIPKEASDVHGITDDMVKDAPSFLDVANQIIEFISGSDIAGFNSNRFDVPLLFNEFDRIGVIWDHTQFSQIDVFKIFSKNEPRTLSAAVKFYTGKDLEGAHDAGNDVEATVEVLFAQLEKYPDLPQSIEELALYCNDGKKIADLSGKFAYNEAGELIFTFGKNAGKPIKDDTNYLRWMYTGNFASDTKKIIKEFLKLP